MALKNSSRIRLVAFDLDGTLLEGTVFIWKTLHEWFGSDPSRRAAAARDYHAGRISYRQWFEEDLRLLKEAGADRKGILGALSTLRAAPGARETLEELRRRGYRLAVLSGSLDIALEFFFPSDLFHHIFINRLHFDEKGRINGGEPTAYDLDAKAEGLKELAWREKLALEQCAFVGDNTNDLEAMRAAGLAVAIDAKSPEVARAADVVLERGCISQLLAVLAGDEKSRQ